MIVQEVYIGRVPEIEEIFQEFKTLRQTYRVWKSGNTAKRTLEIEKMIENLWGFKTFSLTIDPSSVPNAYTFPVANSIDISPDEYLITNSKGYKFNKDANVAAISKITQGLFTNSAYTDEEVFAVFLHEIGHSFVMRSPYIAAQQDIYKSMLITQIIMNIIFGILTANPVLLSDAMTGALLSTNLYKKFVAEYKKTVKKIPILRNISDVTSAATGTIMNLIGNISYLLITGTGLNALFAKINKKEYDMYIKKQIELTGHPAAYDRSAERLSDDFATMYGFGPQLSSALVKMENPKNQGTFMNITHSIPILEKLFNKSDAMVSEINGLLGAHPSSADRILNIIESMEKDLATDKSIPDKVKKEMRMNIEKTKTLVRDIKSDSSKITNKNQYIQALTVLGLQNGNSEDFIEKKYNDREALKKFYDQRKVRKEAAFMEQAELDLFCIEEGLEDYI